jgi:hypothetical protein
MSSRAQSSELGPTTAGTRRAQWLFGVACLAALGLVALLGGGTPSVGATEAFPGQGFLPHGRAWEMVSPADKNGGYVAAGTGRTRVASGGDVAEFYSVTGFGEPEGTGIVVEYISQRSTDPDPGDSGWSTHPITPRQEGQSQPTLFAGDEAKYAAFSEDFSRAAFFSISPLTEAPTVSEVYNVYRRDNVLDPGPGSFELLTNCLPSPAGPCDPEAPLIVPVLNQLLRVSTVVGASTDLSHVLLWSHLRLTNDAPAQGPVRVYDATGGAPRLASVLPTGSTAQNAVPGRMARFRHYTPHTISADGNRIFFVANNADFNIPLSKTVNTGQLYVRINANSTVQLNTSERTAPATPQDAEYWDASVDGTRVFFTSTEPLTDDAPAGPAKLYMWKQAGDDETQSVEVDATGGTFTLAFHGQATGPIAFDASPEDVEGALEQLTTVKPGNVSVGGGPGAAAPYEVTFTGDFAGANVAQLSASGAGLSGGAATASVATTVPVENLTYLSVDEEAADGGAQVVAGVVGASASGHRVYFLAKGQLVEGAPAVPVLGLYLWEEGQVRFVGRVDAAGDSQGMLHGTSIGVVIQSHITPGGDLMFGTSTGDGLLSVRGGVDYDHGPAECPIEVTLLNGCVELYVYDADEDDLQCASCNPSGAAGTANAATRAIVPELSSAPSSHPYFNRALSDDGRYAFFSTAERLVAEDTNGVTDAYVYDTETEEPSLLSSGESSSRSFFMDASADGGDAFFLTAEALSGWDVDSTYDLYDARVGGGFPEPPPPPPSCQGDACQPAPVVLNDPTPGSANFSGPGDQTEARPTGRLCPKGTRLKKTRAGKHRCVKRKPKPARTRNHNRRTGR